MACRQLVPTGACQQLLTLCYICTGSGTIQKMTQTQLGYGQLVARNFFSFLCSGGFTAVSDSALNLVFSLTLTDVAVTIQRQWPHTPRSHREAAWAVACWVPLCRSSHSRPRAWCERTGLSNSQLRLHQHTFYFNNQPDWRTKEGHHPLGYAPLLLSGCTMRWACRQVIPTLSCITSAST